MTQPVLLVLGLVASIAFAVLAKRLQLPYPIVFVLAGTALAFVPGLPAVEISPDWIFLAVLPPLLFSAGWTTDWAVFRANARPILQLAIGLVIVTTLAVAAVAHRIVPGLAFAPAFALGAIVSPTDAIAASATFTRFAIPRRIIGIVEGEGLVNDATALVIYGYAVAAAAAVAFSLLSAVESFVIDAVGGVLLGLIVAWCVEFISRKLAQMELSDSLIDNLILIGAPYVAYLIGQAIHVSAVLAVVVAGITLSRRSSVVYSPQVRLIAWNVWSLWIFVLNAYMFLLIGLQLHLFIAAGSQFSKLLPAAAGIAILVVVVRLLWVYPAAWIARLIPAVKRNEPLPPVSALTLIGWTGMRGIVSLAAALALPKGFPHRDVIVFITFIVIFVTLVGEGLTLDPLLNFLHIREEEREDVHEAEVRIRALESGLLRIAELEKETSDDHVLEDLERLRSEYESRIEHLRSEMADESDLPTPSREHLDYAEREALNAERRAIMELRDRGEIPDEAFRRIEYDLDLAESRLKLER
jgi:CPA1 family monovalent cation:H+ antiporter